MSFEVVTEFENKIKEFFGAPHAVAVDCCTHGIELCLRHQRIDCITVPNRTYLSVPFLADKLNIELKNEAQAQIGAMYEQSLIDGTTQSITLTPTTTGGQTVKVWYRFFGFPARAL